MVQQKNPGGRRTAEKVTKLLATKALSTVCPNSLQFQSTCPPTSTHSERLPTMTATSSPFSWPDHTQLPETDDTFVKTFQEHPQSVLLTDAILPTLQRLYPDGQFCIGQDSGIYWRMTDPPERGADAPDWFFVPNVPPTLDGQFRRSYVLWQEIIPPLLVLEFVSGDGREERDRTPWRGKFWVYEQAIRPAFYGIYEVQTPSLEMWHFVENHFEPLSPNARGHYPIPAMGAELGLWQGSYFNLELPWLRWWDLEGHLLLTGNERADQSQQRADRLAEQLRALGVDPDAVD